MENTLDSLKKIIPDGLELLLRRYTILMGIAKNEPIGRRQLAQVLNSTEKVIRNEIELLKNFAYIHVASSGMSITEEGQELLEELEIIAHYLKGLTGIQEIIREKLDCQKVVVVPGDVDQEAQVKKDLGKAASKVLLNKLEPQSIVAITGGSTAYEVVEAIKPGMKRYKDVLVLPARGSLRNPVNYQSNSIVATLATRIGGRYELLNIPDNLSRKALESVRGEPEIQQTIEHILKATIILHGIGNALEMAKRRNLPETVLDFLKRKEAVAETLGYYFNKHGEIVYTSRSIGIKLEQMTKQAYPIAVAGGKNKAESIWAVRQFIKKGCLIIDEGAAKGILQLIQNL